MNQPDSDKTIHYILIANCRMFTCVIGSAEGVIAYYIQCDYVDQAFSMLMHHAI